MDKITGISTGTPVSESPKPGKLKTNSLFEQNLDAARAKNQGIETSAAGTAPLGEVRPAILPIVSIPSAGIAKNTDKLLDMLEAYTKDIENPNKTLKEIEPLIVSIRKKASQLMEEVETITPEDTKLASIARESAVAANVAYIKFYRGDYI